MSGRDMRNFVTSHRADNKAALVQRVTDGFYSSKYRQVDYDQLKAITAKKKSSGEEKLAKVKKLQQASKQSKEQQLLCQHRMVWKKELSRLKAAQKQSSIDVERHILENRMDSLSGHIYQELSSYGSQLDGDREEFHQVTTPAIYNLRSDLKYWMDQAEVGFKDPNVEQDPQRVWESLDKVKHQQENLLRNLDLEQQKLEQELQAGELAGIHLSRVPMDRLPETGIPEAAFDLECCDLELKASVLQEFILIDQRYLERLAILDQEHCDNADSVSPTGGWPEDDHFVFMYVLDQYTHDVKDRRMLYIDRMRRELPHLSRAQIVAHEDWWTQYRYYHERRRDLVSDWLRDRGELLNRATVVFEEAESAERERRGKQRNLEEQRRHCDALYQQVAEWRQQKMEAMRLHEAAEAEYRRVSAELQQQEQSREKARREKDKQKIHEFKEKQESEIRRHNDAQRRRLEALRDRLEEQAKYDSERVRFREEERQKRSEAQARLEEDRIAAEGERQAVLERIREKVRPHVQADLLRLWSDTAAWHTRVYGQTDTDATVNIQKPLFELNTFSANKIVSDPRFRFAEQLHTAGLSQNPYAREAFSKLQPLQAPRRDMESNVFKYN